MAKKAEDRKTYSNIPMDFFVQQCRTIDGAGLNFTLKSENPGDDRSVWFRVHHGMTMASYGEKITITLRPAGGGTDVHILSECGMPTQLVDYGRNRQNCAAIFAYFDKAAAAAVQPQPQPYIQAQPQQQFTQPQPYVQPAAAAASAVYGTQDYVFCTECGTRNAREANFCMKCGARLLK